VSSPHSSTLAPYHVMLKPRGAICDLDCTYCYYLAREELYPGSDFRMSEEVLDTFTRQYITSQESPEIVFGWQGGEPTLMGLEFFRQAVAVQERYRTPGTNILNTLQTNGMSLTDEWCEFFAENGFLIGISIDGPARVHDAYRIDKGGKPTFDRVMRGAELLRRHGVEFNVLTTVHEANADRPVEVYRFLRDDVGTSFIQFIPVVEPIGDGNASERSVMGAAYGTFLSAIFDEWVRNDVGRVFVQIFDVALAAWVGLPPGMCVFEETCGNALALEHNGDLYSCDHFVDPAHRLGNIREQALPVLVGGEAQRAFGEDKKTGLPGYCRECEVRFACNGGCPKNRFTRTPEGDPGLNWLCEGYRSFFNHIDPAMHYMVEALRDRRPPAGIMQVLEDGTDPLLARAYGRRKVTPA
jgi:uncharacterized protein